MPLEGPSRPPTVLIMDSGVGGLSIYQPLYRRFPALHYLYAFDNAGFPYGDRSADEVTQRLAALMVAIQQQQRFEVVVIACNTASTTALPYLRQHFSMPIIGVVPALKPAAALTRNGVIGLLATPATIQRPYIEALIQQFASHCQVVRLGSTALVRVAEAKLRGEQVTAAAIATILLPWLQLKKVPDTVVLGCTHFSLLKSMLLAVLPLGTQVIDSTAAIVHQVERTLLSLGAPLTDTERYPDTAALRLGNQAYCTQWNAAAQALQPALQHYQLQILRNIVC